MTIKVTWTELAVILFLLAVMLLAVFCEVLI